MDHGGEHRYLGIEGVHVGGGEAGEVTPHDGVPAGVGGVGEVLDFLLGDVLALNDRTAGTAREHRDHAEMVFEPTKDRFVAAGLDLLRPETIVVKMADEAGHADSDRVLGT